MVVDWLKVRDDLREFSQVVERDFSAIISDLFFARPTVVQKIKKDPLYAITDIPHIAGTEFISKRLRLLDCPSYRRRVQTEACSNPEAAKSRCAYTRPPPPTVKQLPRPASPRRPQHA